MRTNLSLLVALSLLAGCSSSSTNEAATPLAGDGGCPKGSVVEGGACIDPLRRFEPAARLDENNVVSYGPDPTLDLPPPPKSGFRLVVTPRALAPNAEVEACQAWAYPEFQNKFVYAARVYTNGALHHSNMYGVPLSAEGASDYPSCKAGQANVAAQVPNFLQGNIMDVLFANSTQIEGGEQIVFPKGMAFRLTTEGREIATTIHWVNVRDQDFTSEVVYDFFTTSEDNVTQEIVPFVYDNQGFRVPAHSEGQISTTCDLLHDSRIVSIMPHTHQRVNAFDVELVDSKGTKKSIFHDGNFDSESDITVFDEPIDTAGFTQMHHTCSVGNDLDEPIIWGVGKMEMCTLFGYLYPPSAQQLGFVAGPAKADGNGDPCVTLDLGSYRK